MLRVSEKILWRTSSLEKKWADGKGDVRLAVVEYFDKTWIDLRIINVTDGKNQHTRQAVRLSLEQAQEMLPRLIEGIEAAQDAIEKKERES